MRVFIDHLDTYTPKNIGEVISQSVVGSIEVEKTDGDKPYDDDDTEDTNETPTTFEVVGSLKSSQSTTPKWAAKAVSPDEDDEKLNELLQSADIYVFDMTESTSRAVSSAEYIMKFANDWESPKKIICISSVLTWARTKMNAEDPEASLTEDEYRRRKAHPNCKETLKAEKLITKLGKHANLQTHIVMSGLLYGQGENIFHPFFKAAWQGHGDLPVFGKGDNVLPMIHVIDLAQVILNLTDKNFEEKYVIAVDESSWTLQDIMSCISNHLGNGETTKVTKEDALLMKETEMVNYDMLLVNLRMETTAVKEMRIDWVAERGMIDSIAQVVQQFKLKRGLSPVKMIMHGAPGIGKTHFAKIISQQYKLHHIKINDVVTEAIVAMKNKINLARDTNGDSEAHDNPQIAAESERLEEIMEAASNNGGRYIDEHICAFVREKLLTMPCQNQGYVLDGFPKTTQQAQMIFKANEDSDEADEGDRTVQMYNEKIIPGTVFAFDASDNFLEERVMNLAEAEVTGTHNTEEGQTRRLRAHRQINTEENTVMNYFDELEIHPVDLDASKDESSITDLIVKELGKPNNYGPTPEEVEEMNRIREAEETQAARDAEKEQARMEQEERQHRQKRDEEWSERFEQLKKEEAEILAERSAPLRAYLAKNIMPSLTKALIETCKIRPDDPVDFIAEFLFNCTLEKENAPTTDSQPSHDDAADPVVPSLPVETSTV